MTHFTFNEVKTCLQYINILLLFLNTCLCNQIKKNELMYIEVNKKSLTLCTKRPKKCFVEQLRALFIVQVDVSKRLMMLLEF
jgi:hypothetical protein